MLDEFKDFVSEKSLIEVAVGLVLALAFTALVTSLVDGLLMPLLAAIVGEPTFDSLTFEINGAIFYYGTFITQVINFVLVAAALFFFVVRPLAKVMKSDDNGA
jgi:large conductance mechanosensitive channel